MELILLENITNLGNLGDRVSVKPGYGRNYLVPQRKAVHATAEKIAEFEKMRAQLEKKAADEISVATARAAAIANLNVVIAQKAGDEGRLFGSVGTQDIAAAVGQAGVELKRHEVRLPDGALRQVGDFEIELQLHSEVIATLALAIVPE